MGYMIIGTATALRYQICVHYDPVTYQKLILLCSHLRSINVGTAECVYFFYFYPSLNMC